MRIKSALAGALVFLIATAGGLMLPLTTTTAFAQESESRVLYRRKLWEVRVVAFDDGSVACIAEVAASNGNFLIWWDAVSNPMMQFFSDDWQFDNEVADIILQIDRRGKWTLNDADLTENSVFFQLNDEDGAIRLIEEIMRGNRLKLSNSNGQQIESYPLAGSHASILKLVECVELLDEYDDDSNPFN